MNKLRRIRHLEACFLHSLCNKVPVDSIPELGEVLGLPVLVVDVPGVLPGVDAEDREARVLDRVQGVGVLVDGDGLVSVDGEVAPAAAEDGGGLLGELGLELLEVAEVLVDELSDTSRTGLLLGGEALPEEVVVVDLSNVVEDRARGLLDDLLDRLALELGARDILVSEVDVGLVVLRDVDLNSVRGQESRDAGLHERDVANLEHYQSEVNKNEVIKDCSLHFHRFCGLPIRTASCIG